MNQIRGILGGLGFVVAAGLLVMAIDKLDWRWGLAALAALLVGFQASFRKIVCAECGARIWVSSRKAVHCIRCGAGSA